MAPCPPARGGSSLPLLLPSLSHCTLLVRPSAGPRTITLGHLPPLTSFSFTSHISLSLLLLPHSSLSKHTLCGGLAVAFLCPLCTMYCTVFRTVHQHWPRRGWTAVCPQYHRCGYTTVWLFLSWCVLGTTTGRGTKGILYPLAFKRQKGHNTSSSLRQDKGATGHSS